MRFLVALLFTLVATPVAAAPYYNPELHYSFDLPERWVDIPRHVLTDLIKEDGKATGEGERPLVAGFQDIKRPWLTYPYVVIQHHVSKGETLSELAADLDQLAKESSLAPPNQILRKPRFDHPTLDLAHNVVTFPLELEVEGLGRVRGMSALFPGKQWVVQIAFYSTEASFERDWALFKPSLATFRYDPGYAYKDRNPQFLKAKAWLRRHQTQAFAAAALVGLAILLVLLRSARNREI